MQGRPASPVARRIAAAYGLDLASVAGSGPRGRIRKVDVQAQIEAGAAGAPSGARAADAPLRSGPRPLPIASQPPDPNLQPPTSAQPIITATIEADATAALALCAAQGPAFQRLRLQLTLTTYIAWAAAALLPEHPALQAAWSEEGLVQRRRTHLAVAEGAADTLRWALIANAGDLTLRGMARAIGAEDPPDLRGATFSVVGLTSAQIRRIAAPPLPGTAAALSVGAPRLTPIAAGDSLLIRPLIDLSISYDARALDYRQAMAFLLALCGRIAHAKAMP